MKAPAAGSLRRFWSWLAGVLTLNRPDGIVVGSAFMARRLHFFTSDLKDTRWYAGGAAPIAELPPSFRMRWLTEAEWRARPDILETAADVVAARFKSDARCLIAWDDDANRLAYHLWVTETGAYIDWIFRYIETPPEHLFVFDVWVHPDYRGGNLHWAGAGWSCNDAMRCGRRRIFAGVEEHEYYPFMMKYARLGLGLGYPYSQIVGFKLFDMRIHFPMGPSPRLARFSDRLHKLYGKSRAK